MKTQLQIQPTFEVQFPVELQDATKRIATAVREDEFSEHAASAGSVIDFKIEPEQQRFWSPHLSVQLSAGDETNSTKAYCRFSPRPEIFTMVAAIYFVAACCVCLATIVAVTQWTMGNRPWALLGVPIGLAFIATLYAASVIGQRLSHDQMDVLRGRLERVFDAASLSQTN